MKKLAILAALIVAISGFLGLAPSQAVASTPPPPDCTSFNWIQTYDPSAGWLRAPAWYYGGTVTIDYQAVNCSFFQDKQGRFVLRLTGTATVYSGTSASGTPIDVRPFQNIETWKDPTNTWGWPANWWSCSVEQAQYKWIIPGVYDFTATAHKGYWTYQQTAFTSPPQRSGGEFNACP